ncbi:hypothetical protein COV24_02310 [candidate division WWE3 bacterium CG10_big_fil_rev_8_21_14_0_10_32_10]|uniref:VTT domain-containing protein n=1 Tax=candidate division WWE3 bacterium CG10_big_fil_rev_8_21_14_0_10_32_10 TaxID=1975090 RepID=A0A2H0RAG7_UNCKA|nr:MAG: hypothetical protein COV24_02310 [candidate division WWE3 bacterium CG10_big_fil_rev_8_21_14_0_10_32_10]
MLNPDILMHWLLIYKYWILLPLVIIEGPISSIIGGFLSSTGFMSLFIVYPISIAGDIMGDSFYYVFGYFGREKFIKRFGKYIGIKQDLINKLDTHFDKYPGRSIFIGKISYGLSIPILFAAGFTKVSYTKYLKYSLYATMPKCLVLVLVGYYFGHTYKLIFAYVKYASVAVSLIIVLGILIYYVMIRVARYFESKY